MSRPHRQSRLLDDLSHADALRAQSQIALAGPLLIAAAGRFAGRRNAGSDIRNDLADRNYPAAIEVLQPTAFSPPAYPAPLDMHSSHSESILHDTVRRVLFRLSSQIGA